MQRAQITICLVFADECQKPFDDALITRVRGLFCLYRLRLQPVRAPLAEVLPFKRFEICALVNVGQSAFNNFSHERFANSLFVDRKSTRLNSSHVSESRMP